MNRGQDNLNCKDYCAPTFYESIYNVLFRSCQGGVSQRTEAGTWGNHGLGAPPRGQSQDVITEHSLLERQRDLAAFSQEHLSIKDRDCFLLPLK